MTHDELIPHYSYLHEATRYGLCPNDRERAAEIATFLRAHLEPGATVLDCSAGRGHLLRLMRTYGLQCSATEADPYLVAHDLAEFETWCLRYGELDTLQPRTWDAVVSCEVLEHLLTEDEVRAALRSLAALSRRWLCLTVGTGPSSWYETASGQTVRLHYVVRDASWWSREVAQVATIREEHVQRIANISYVMFCEVTHG